MKQPLMIIPPAQAEALYDAALEDEKTADRYRIPINTKSVDDWDDGLPSDSNDRNHVPRNGLASRPRRPMLV